MLEQANPRTVDFGSTTLQSAIEKAVDHVFNPERDAQDLVIRATAATTARGWSESKRY